MYAHVSDWKCWVYLRDHRSGTHFALKVGVHTGQPRKLMQRKIPNQSSTQGESHSTLIHMQEASQARRIVANKRACGDGIMQMVGLGLLVTFCAVM